MAVVVFMDVRRLRVPGYVAPWPVTAVPRKARRIRVSLENNGLGCIRNTVKRKASPTNVPIARRVRLYRDRDGLLMGETFSRASDGYYEFMQVDTRYAYTVIAYDYENNYRAVLADNLTLANGGVELMP